MSTAAHDVTIITAVIGMGRNLKHCVVAEGVETSDQLTMLRELSCDEGQGYHLGRPLDADRFAQLVQKTAPASSTATLHLAH